MESIDNQLEKAIIDKDIETLNYLANKYKFDADFIGRKIYSVVTNYLYTKAGELVILILM